MGAQLVYLTEKTKETTPKGKAMSLLPCLIIVSRLSTAGKRRFYSVPYGIGEKKVVIAPSSGTLFNTSIDFVRPEKRPTVPDYVNEFLD